MVSKYTEALCFIIDHWKKKTNQLLKDVFVIITIKRRDVFICWENKNLKLWFSLLLSSFYNYYLSQWKGTVSPAHAELDLFCSVLTGNCQCSTGVTVCTDACSIQRTLPSLLLSEVTNATCMGLNTAWVTWEPHRSHHWEAACLHLTWGIFLWCSEIKD